MIILGKLMTKVEVLMTLQRLHDKGPRTTRGLTSCVFFHEGVRKIREQISKETVSMKSIFRSQDSRCKRRLRRMEKEGLIFNLPANNRKWYITTSSREILRRLDSV